MLCFPFEVRGTGSARAFPHAQCHQFWKIGATLSYLKRVVGLRLLSKALYFTLVVTQLVTVSGISHASDCTCETRGVCPPVLNPIANNKHLRAPVFRTRYFMLDYLNELRQTYTFENIVSYYYYEYGCS